MSTKPSNSLASTMQKLSATSGQPGKSGRTESKEERRQSGKDRIDIWLPTQISRDLDGLSERLGIPRNEVIARAIAAYKERG